MPPFPQTFFFCQIFPSFSNFPAIFSNLFPFVRFCRTSHILSNLCQTYSLFRPPTKLLAFSSPFRLLPRLCRICPLFPTSAHLLTFCPASPKLLHFFPVMPNFLPFPLFLPNLSTFLLSCLFIHFSHAYAPLIPLSPVILTYHVFSNLC